MSAVPVKLTRLVTPAPTDAALKRLVCVIVQRRHEAAVAPAHDAHAVGVADPHVDDPVDAGHEVVIIAAAPVAAIGIAELGPVAAGAAGLGRSTA